MCQAVESGNAPRMEQTATLCRYFLPVTARHLARSVGVGGLLTTYPRSTRTNRGDLYEPISFRARQAGDKRHMPAASPSSISAHALHSVCMVRAVPAHLWPSSRTATSNPQSHTIGRERCRRSVGLIRGSSPGNQPTTRHKPAHNRHTTPPNRSHRNTASQVKMGLAQLNAMPMRRACRMSMSADQVSFMILPR